MRRDRGFTLIEMMVAMAIVAMTMTLVWGTFNGTNRAKSRAETFAARYRSVRLTLLRLTRDLEQAYLSQNEDTTQTNRRTQFVGKPHGSFDEITFSYFGHQRLYKDADESDTALVQYAAFTDRGDSRKTNLVRRESRRLQYARIDEMAGEGDIICDDIQGFKLQYWDPRDKKWREDWITTSADGQPDRLPPKVRITLSVKDEQGSVVPFVSEARIAMQEPLNSTPQEVQAQGGAVINNPQPGNNPSQNPAPNPSLNPSPLPVPGR